MNSPPKPTVNFALIALVADFAEELRDALLSVKPYGHRLVMVAE